MKNDKREFLTSRRAVCSILTVAVLLLAMALPLEAKTFTLRFSSYNPPRGMEAQTSLWLMDEIAKRTNGQVKFEHYFGESLLKARETLKGIQAGTADMGFLMTAYFPKELPLWSVGQPFIRGPSHPEKRAAFFWELYARSPSLEGELAKWNQKLVAIHVFGKMSVGGPRPIKSLADLKGIKVRCASGYEASNMSALGAKVVFLKAPEVYSAMQKGAIDANMTPVTSYYKYRLYEIGDKHHLLEIPNFTGVLGLITINLGTLKSLPADVQKVVSETGKEYSKMEAEEILALEKDYKDKMKAAGCTIIGISVEQVQKWADLCEEDNKAKWIKDAKAQGLPGENLMDLASQLIKKYSD